MFLKTPKALPTLAALLAFTTFTSIANAELVVRDLNTTLSGEEFAFDLDQDGVNDFLIIDSGDQSTIVGLGQDTASVFVGESNPMPLVFSAGSVVDGKIGFPSLESVGLYGPGGGAFSSIGSNGFIGLSLTSKDEPREVNFGFVEITRGSTILGQVGYQTTPGAGASIPVPEPAAAAVLLAGLTGLLTRRRNLARS